MSLTERPVTVFQYLPRKKPMTFKTLLATAMATLSVALHAQAPRAALAPPHTKTTPVVDDYHGTKVTDPYRWMEAGDKDPDFLPFLKAQDAHARAVKAASAATEARMKAAVDRLTPPTSFAYGMDQTYLFAAGDTVFYLVSDKSGQVWLTERSKAGTTRTLVGTESLAPAGSKAAFDCFRPSPDGRTIVVCFSINGSEDSTLRVLDVASGRFLPGQVEHCIGASPTWVDAHAFLYGRSGSDSFRDSERIDLLHRLGDDFTQDEPVFGDGLSWEAWKPGRAPMYSYPVAAEGSAWVMVYALPDHPEDNLFSYTDGTRKDGKRVWRPLFDASDKVLSVQIRQGRIYASSVADRYPHGAILEAVPTEAGFKRRVLYEPQDSWIKDDFWGQGFVMSGDALYVVSQRGGVSRLTRVPYGSGGTSRSIRLPFESNLTTPVPGPGGTGVLFVLESWFSPKGIWKVDPSRAAATSVATFGDALNAFHAQTLRVPSTDGAMVPVTLLFRGKKPPKNAPLLMMGYGAYGNARLPFYSPTTLAWLLEGGTYAILHARGGGEFGEAWHVAALGRTKQHTVDDGIAAIEYLIAHRFTSSSKVAVTGESAGGILAGGILVQRPDLCAMVWIHCGAVDPLKVGPLAECGDPSNPDDFPWVYRISPYAHVQQGVPYPGVILDIGLHDQRIPNWVGAKMAARLQAASASGKPILLNVDFDGGHFASDDTILSNQAYLMDCLTGARPSSSD